MYICVYIYMYTNICWEHFCFSYVTTKTCPTPGHWGILRRPDCSMACSTHRLAVSWVKRHGNDMSQKRTIQCTPNSWSHDLMICHAYDHFISFPSIYHHLYTIYTPSIYYLYTIYIPSSTTSWLRASWEHHLTQHTTPGQGHATVQAVRMDCKSRTWAGLDRRIHHWINDLWIENPRLDF